MTKTVGIIGAGQLGQMLGFAGQSLGLEFIFLDPADSPPAAAAGKVLRYPFDSQEGLAKLSSMSDLITYEFENVPVAALDNIAMDTPVYPPAEALLHAQDRLAEKQLFTSIGIPVPEFLTIDSVADLEQAAVEIGLPIVLKTRRLGYDGKGQQIVRKRGEFEQAVTGLGNKDLIAEQWVPFDREVSVIGSRSVQGEICIYPLSENQHRNGILNVSRAPADGSALDIVAQGYLTDLLNRLNYVGTLALELFEIEGRLLANEFAPRVHNSGHWTIEGAETSQFENHLRAILDMPLGESTMRGCAGMINLIGTMPGVLPQTEGSTCYLHDYGKSPRPGRKLGHITVLADSVSERDDALSKIAEKLVR
ncbi:MAG: 5-(carboxyamino)imidazole ribonucleotide synthase [Woeseiaceae bacterium]